MWVLCDEDTRGSSLRWQKQYRARLWRFLNLQVTETTKRDYVPGKPDGASVGVRIPRITSWLPARRLIFSFDYATLVSGVKAAGTRNAL